MTYTSPRFVGSWLVAALAFSLPATLPGEIHSRSNEISVEQSSDLPEQARVPGDACLLYQDTAGRTYLYIEQQHGAQLVAFDVTDPARIRLASSTPLTVSGAFDFVRPASNHAELIRFRDHSGTAVLNLQKPKSPALSIINSASQPGSAEALTETVFLMENQATPQPSVVVPHDFHVIDISAPSGPVILATIRQVTQTVVNNDTGTTFLLGSDGLTVIRHTRTERDHRLMLAQQASN